MNIRSLLLTLLILPTMVKSTPNSTFLTQLFAAARTCDAKKAESLISKGVNVNELNTGQQSAISLAYLCPEVTSILLEAGADPNGGIYPALVPACANYSVKVIQMLLEAGADPNLPAAVDPGAGLRVLLEKEKAKGEEANQHMISAWERAVEKIEVKEVFPLQVTLRETNCVPCLEMLFEHKVDPGNGNPMHLLTDHAASKEKRRKDLQNKKPNVETLGLTIPEWYTKIGDERNGTPEEMLEVLLENGININEENRGGFSPLVLALKHMNSSTAELEELQAFVKRMIEKGANPSKPSVVTNQRVEIWFYPICQAAEYGDTVLIKMMLDRKADINSTTSSASVSAFNGTHGGKGYSPLIISIFSGNIPVAEFLIDHGANLSQGVEGIAITQTHDKSISCIVEVKNKNPIIWAIERNYADLIKQMVPKLKNSFNPNYNFKPVADAQSLTLGEYNVNCEQKKSKVSPSEYAEELGRREIAEYLQSNGL